MPWPVRAQVTDQIDFYVLKDFFGLVSQYSIVSAVQDRRTDYPSLTLRKMVQHLLRDLLSLIHPCAESQIDDFDSFVKVARAARKYRMYVVGDTGKLKHQLDASLHIVDDR